MTSPGINVKIFDATSGMYLNTQKLVFKYIHSDKATPLANPTFTYKEINILPSTLRILVTKVMLSILLTNSLLSLP